MTDLISRSAVLETINEVDISDCTDIDDIIDRIYSEVASVPAADAVPVVHARWEYLIGNYYCTNCDKKLRRSSRTKRPKYCERCGARMDAEEATNEHQTD